MTAGSMEKSMAETMAVAMVDAMVVRTAAAKAAMRAVVKVGLWADYWVVQMAARLAAMSDWSAARMADKMVDNWAVMKGYQTAEWMVVLKAANSAGPMEPSLVGRKVGQLVVN